MRDTDVLCSWGRYATALFASKEGYLAPDRLDLRQVARVYTKGKVGTLEDFVARLGIGSTDPLASGRAGMRLGQLAAVAAHLATAARPA